MPTGKEQGGAPPSDDLPGDRQLSGSAADFFGSMSASYDSLIRRAVPDYQDIIDTLISYLPPAASRVTELGCGTGNLSLRLAARYPTAEITCVDAADDMVELTRARVSAAALAVAERARFVVARFEELEAGAGSDDLVTSSFSLHHVADKRPLFAKIRARLRNGGRLCFADQLRGANAATQQVDWDHWIAFCRLPGHCTEDELQSLIEHSHAHDHYETVPDLTDWLRAAGFAEVDCLWRKGMWGIISATAV
jgi:tRNA (cmo5U34)-methyltransferase